MATNDALLTTLPPGTTTPSAVGVAGNGKAQATAVLLQEGGSSYPQPDQLQMTGRQKLWLVCLVIIKRVRFLAIVAGVGVFLGYWDTVKLHLNRWTHPRSAAVRQVPGGKEFFCPMEPQVTRSSYEPNGDVPNCPICGMPLSLHDKPAEEELPPGVTGRVNLSPERVVMAGIKTATIGYWPMSRQTKSMGHIACDESRVSRVVSRVDGYVGKLYVRQHVHSRSQGRSPGRDSQPGTVWRFARVGARRQGQRRQRVRLPRRGGTSSGSGSILAISTAWRPRASL